MGCERVADTLVLHLAPQETVVFQIELDDDGLPRGLGPLISEIPAEVPGVEVES